MKKDGDRQKKMEGDCSPGQSSQRAVVPVEEKEEEFVGQTVLLRLDIRLGAAVFQSCCQCLGLICTYLLLVLCRANTFFVLQVSELTSIHKIRAPVCHL
jgi:hypothetical protein